MKTKTGALLKYVSKRYAIEQMPGENPPRVFDLPPPVRPRTISRVRDSGRPSFQSGGLGTRMWFDYEIGDAIEEGFMDLFSLNYPGESTTVCFDRMTEAVSNKENDAGMFALSYGVNGVPDGIARSYIQQAIQDLMDLAEEYFPCVPGTQPEAGE